MRNALPKLWRLRDRTFAICVLMLLQLACGTVRLVSPYDEVLDHGTSDVHAKVGSFAGKMAAVAGKPEGTYEANQQFYPEVSGQISSLILRAKADPKNEVTAKLFGELQKNIGLLQKLHEIGKERGLTRAVSDPALSAIEVNCSAILRLEIAKRRGEDK